MSSKTVLVVDDDMGVRAFIATVLEHELGLRVIHAWNAWQAQEQLRR